MVTIRVQKIQLPESETQPEGKLLGDNYLQLVQDLEVECQLRIGTLNLTIAELSQLQHGQQLQLAEKVSEPIELILNNRPIARGELMNCDDHFAIQITEVAL